MADERGAVQDVQEELLSAKISEKKRTGKFQPLRKLFGKKKKKTSSLLFQEGKLKPSQSIGSVCSNPASTLSSDEEACDDLRFLNNSMGTRAFSHDSIFIPDGQAEDEQETQATSQDHNVGKVKSLQQQLGKNIRFGQPPPSNIPIKRMQDLGATTEEIEATQNSTMDSSGERDIGFLSSGSMITGSPSSHATRNVPQTEHKTEEKVTPVKSSRTKRPSGTIESINLDAVPRSAACLDNSAAKHKLSVKPKNQRVSKKHRGMSQDCYSIEDNEHDTGLNVHRSLNKAMYHSMDISKHDVIMSNYFERKALGLPTLEYTVTKGQYEGKKDWDEKHEEPGIFKSEESRQMDKDKKSEADKHKTEEEQRRQEIIKNIESERLQYKMREQKENEMKEQRRREEEKKLRAEQILKELEEHRRQDEQRQRELEEQKHLRLAEEQKNRELEQQKALQQAKEQKKSEIEQQREQQKAEEQKRQEAEKHRALQLAEEQKMREIEEQKALREAEEQNKRKLEEQRILKLAEKQRKCELEQQKALQIAEERKREVEQQRGIQIVEEQRKRDAEQQRAIQIAEEQSKRDAEQQRAIQIAEEQSKRDAEQQKAIQIAEEQRKRDAEQQKAFKMAEEQRKREQEHQKALQIALEQRKQEMELQKALQIEEEQKKRELELQKISQKVEFHRSHLVEEEKRSDLEEHRAHKAAEEQKGNEVEDQNALQLVEENKLVLEEPLQKGDAINKDVKNVVKAKHSSQDHESSIIEKPEKLKTEEGSKENDVDVKQRQSNEELRWQELDQRQRPFTFKVASGEKQIIFEKVNLSPVTLVKEPLTCPDTQVPKETKANISSHALPSSQCIPHTAILVTGAQLCGTAVNLNQIKDTACKTLLGLNEERKLDIAETKNERDDGNSKHISSKTKYTSETLENQSFMAEWASIRSKMFNKAENVAMTERDKSDPRLSSDELTEKGKGESHNTLRKTMSANAKFSITPAWQKFPETVKTVEFRSEASVVQPSMESIGTVLPDNTAQGRLTERALSVPEVVANKMKRQVTIEDGAEGCIFSKDLPSFLVPNPPQSPRRGHLEGQTSLNAQMTNSMRKTDKLLQSTEEKISPFGIKLRRTHYSLRFHSDPQNEQKRKKRYSAGDSFEGIPTPFTAGDETEVRTLPHKELSASPTKLMKESPVQILLDTSINPPENMHGTLTSTVIPSTSPHLSSPIKIAPKSPMIPKPSLAPKPSSPTPPSSPLSKLNKPEVNDPHVERLEKADHGSVKEEIKAALSPSKYNESLEYDRTDKANLPSIPWREKPEKRPEKTGRDRPVLQSRHSLDGSRLMEKAESAQPLWITLALQKQKGFREQQASREERRQAREAKQADKLAKDNTSAIQTGEYRSRSGSLQKPIPQEEKKCETVVTRLQRREQLQKSNTLPTSVTVEITETVPVTHAKDLPKRFSTPDATPVSSEPAWLALAKRKSKAWSDCPQIIK